MAAPLTRLMVEYLHLDTSSTGLSLEVFRQLTYHWPVYLDWTGLTKFVMVKPSIKSWRIKYEDTLQTIVSFTWPYRGNPSLLQRLNSAMVSMDSECRAPRNSRWEVDFCCLLH